MKTTPILIAALVALAPGGDIFGRDTGNVWLDTYQSRVDVRGLLERFNNELLASRSATAVLEAWCREHQMATPARIVAVVSHGKLKLASAMVRQTLEVPTNGQLRYRHVSLVCGRRVLSEADNWYVPSRLAPAMNRALDTSDIPFGRVIAPLMPERRTLSVEWLWSPLAPRGTHSGTAPNRALRIPPFILRHRAVVLDGKHRPVAFVVETYTDAVLDFQH